MTEDGHKVSLNVYDLSQGLARQLSTTFLGRAIEGIWHTGVVVYGNEYYFGGGIQHSPVGTTPYGTPIRVVDLGVTHVPQELFEDYLQDISPRYTAETYSLLNHNCNNFSNEVAQFLVGATIPEYILQLPNAVTSSPMGAMILPMIQQLETTLRSGAVPQVPQFRPSSSSLTQPIFTVNANNKSEGRPNTISAREANIDNAEVPVKSDDHRPMETGIMSEKPPNSDKMVQPAVKPAGAQEKKTNRVVEDPLGDARSKVQEEISSEFAALMASGTLRASEAAALATRRVMERYGRLNVAMPQS